MAARQLFAVTRKRGPAWSDARPMEEHPGWRAHADFMNGLHEEGLILFWGPLAGTQEVLFAMAAASADEIASRLAPDPWVVNGAGADRALDALPRLARLTSQSQSGVGRFLPRRNSGLNIFD